MGIAKTGLTDQLEHIHYQYHQAIGTGKSRTILQALGVSAGRHRIARLRQAAGLETKRKRRFRKMIHHHNVEPPAPDLVQRGFTVPAPNQVWVGDITAIRTKEGFLYLAIVLDLYARRLVGWSMDAQPAAALPIAALTMAIQHRRPKPGLICHTDQGTQYT